MRFARVLAVTTLVAAYAQAGVTLESHFQKARERAIREDKLIFINFTAAW